MPSQTFDLSVPVFSSASSSNMCDVKELQNLGKSPYQTPSRFNTSTVTLSLRTKVISVVTLIVIFATIILTSVYLIHNHEQVKAQVSIPILSQMVNDLQHQYMEQMHQNISHSFFLDTKTLLQLHNFTKNQIMKIYDETEKHSVENKAETVVTYRNQLSEKIDTSFTTISHEQTFRKVETEDWKVSNEIGEQIKQLYDEEFQAVAMNYKGRDPPEVSSEFQEHVAALTLSKAVALKIVPSSATVFDQMELVLRRTYNKNLEEHVIGIDFGESYIRSFVFSNGQLKKCEEYNTYVDLEDFDLKNNVTRQAENVGSTIYDFKEIIRAWDSFNGSSNNLFWTFNVQKGTNNGPTVSSPTSGIQYPVETVAARLFQEVKEANGVNNCVITIPYDFTEDQRNLILEASNTAGFQKITLLDEDIAAALTLQYVQGPWNATKNIMFLEFNQLSWKIYILEGHQSNFIRIVSEEYSQTQDLVQICIKDFCQQFECDKEAFKYDGSFEARIRWRMLYQECEAAIFQVTENRNKESYPVLGIQKSVTFYGNTVEKAIQKQVENFTLFIDSVLRQRNVKLTKEKIDEVIMGGKYGSLLVIKETISGYFNGRNLTINGVSPVDTVAYGAAVKGLELAAAAIKQGRVNGTAL